MEPETTLLIYELVGAGTAICAGLGILATLIAVFKCMRSNDKEDKEPEFRKFFFLFSGLSLFYNLILVALGALLIAARPISWWLFLIVLLFPWIYTGWLGKLWRNPSYGLALGTATGVGNVGMAMPSMFLLPIWGPLALWIAS